MTLGVSIIDAYSSIIDDSRSIIDDSRSIIDDSRIIIIDSRSIIDDSRRREWKWETVRLKLQPYKVPQVLTL
jgi:hypothetical protein